VSKQTAAAGPPTAVEDALATPAAFELPPEEILRGVTDPEGIRIGSEAAAKIRRDLEAADQHGQEGLSGSHSLHAGSVR
jgi:hypothetical protein